MTLVCNQRAKLSQQGFTMLELLVVMSIMGILLSFVAPLSLEKLENQQRRSAFDKIAYWLKTQSEIAQINGCDNQFQFVGKQITYQENCAQYKNTDIQFKTYRSQDISFAESTVFLNKHGVFIPAELSAWYEGSEYTFNISSGEFTSLSDKAILSGAQ